MPIKPFAVQRGGGAVLATPTGDTAVVMADTDQTGGAMSVLDLVVAPQVGPALHRHEREDELWVVVEGEFRFKAGDQMLGASTGGLAFGPRGVPHCFQNVGDQPGRLLIVTTPAGLEGFFRDFAAHGDASQLVQTALAYGVEFVGPPLPTSV
jgi:mannose-6-phosphate isomerase-like protein (cupin superfamily)